MPIFYHPHCYELLRALHDCLPELAAAPDRDIRRLLAASGLQTRDARSVYLALEKLGLTVALAHCRRQGKTPDQFLRQFHQWFDAFKTLKFIHAARDAGWPMQSLEQLGTVSPNLWPARRGDVETLRAASAARWGWG